MSLSERRQERRHDHRSGFAPSPPRADGPTDADFHRLLASLGLSGPTGRTAPAPDAPEAAFKKIDEMLFTAFLLDIAAHAAKVKEQEPPKSEPQTPFFRFWRKLNESLEADGLGTADYGFAKRAFLGGETPVGAMTFIGKQWDGLRAVPSEPVTELGGKRPAYHGEYRVVGDDGTRWIKVTDKHDLPIAFGIPEAAITAAERERD